MTRLWRAVRGFVGESRGFAALEYTLITVVIGTVVIACVDTLGNAYTTALTGVGSVLTQHASGL